MKVGGKVASIVTILVREATSRITAQAVPSEHIPQVRTSTIKSTENCLCPNKFMQFSPQRLNPIFETSCPGSPLSKGKVFS